MSLSDTPVAGEREGALRLGLESFDYARVGDQVAVLQVLAAVAADGGTPANAELILYTGAEAPLLAPARACRCERRLLSGGKTELLWRVLFTVPLALVERGSILFELSSGTPGADTLMLPVPVERQAGPPALQLLPSAALARSGARPLRQAVAVATAVAMTAGSTSSLALAASGSSPVSHPGPAASGSSPVSHSARAATASHAPLASPAPLASDAHVARHAWGSQERISELAHLAHRQLHQQSAKRVTVKLRSATHRSATHRPRATTSPLAIGAPNCAPGSGTAPRPDPRAAHCPPGAAPPPII